MKVKFKRLESYFSNPEVDTIKEFVNFLQKSLPLNKDTFVSFDEGRDGKMTTGVRRPNHHIHVLVKNRLLIDILRTLSHEWTHEFQHQKMGLKDTEPIQDIGGPEENMANVLSGIFIKQFAKNFPEYKKVMFGEID